MDFTSSSHTSVKHRFIHLFPLLAILVIAVLYSGTLKTLIERWTKWDESLSHALVLIAIFFYLLFRSLPWGTVNRNVKDLAALPCLLLSAALWYIGCLASITIIEQIAFFLIILFYIGSAYSLSTLWKHRILFGLLLFTIPIWDQLNTPLVNLSGLVVGKIVSLISIPASIEGNSIFIPSGHIIIADGCSGLRYLEISMALGVLICLLNNYTEKQLIPALIISIMLGLLANWLRIFILVMIGYQSEMQSSLMHDHEFFGWVLFALICFPAMYLAPVIKVLPTNTKTASTPYWITPTLVVIIFPIVFHFTQWKNDNSQPQELLRKIGYSFTSPTNSLLIGPEAPTLTEAGERKIDDKIIVAQRLHYKKTNQNQKLVPYISHLFETDNWLLTSSVKNNNVQYNILKMKNSSEYVAQILWFQLGSYNTNSVLNAKLLQIPATAQGISIFTITSLESRCNQPTCEQELSLLAAQAQQLKNTH